MTNAEKIRSMSNRELAELIVSGEWSAICPFCRYYCTDDCKYVSDNETCIKGVMEFLDAQATGKEKTK